MASVSFWPFQSLLYDTCAVMSRQLMSNGAFFSGDEHPPLLVGRGTGSHALDDAFDPANSWQGSQRALLLAIALAQQ